VERGEDIAQNEHVMVLFGTYFNYLAVEIITKTERHHNYNLLFFIEKIALFFANYMDIICTPPPLESA
jgi:hypothetical protein